jgi:UDP-glucose 4-epimerase
MNVLVAGGAGYIGSHTVKRLKEAGHSPVIYDNLSRGHRTVVDILKVPAVAADLNDRGTLVDTLREHRIDTVMHFAAYAYVGESVEKPLLYYQNNVATTVSVLEAMQEVGVDRFVFSSTCAVYGDPDKIPITEDEKRAPVSPYGRSKLMVEQVLADLPLGWKNFKFAALRYFNASGCANGRLAGRRPRPGDSPDPGDPAGGPGRAAGHHRLWHGLSTKDGTNVRDYIHVDDLADAHIAAMER